MRAEPSQQSKALAVNPRTLDILQPTGITRRMLELGLPVYGVRFYRQGRVVAAIPLTGIHPKYPLMLALSQTVTEKMLAQAFEAAGGVYFAGDAAHIHSPVGAGGMNLGLEDAWVFAELVRAKRLPEYDRLRRPVDEQVVRRVELLSRIASAESGVYRFLRAFVFPMAIKIPPLRDRMVGAVTGLDHKLPDLTPVRGVS
jgi:2-polyprenyl-6-methoxyphenol hydroxylase-like FAD-dependent oxidoreductase